MDAGYQREGRGATPNSYSKPEPVVHFGKETTILQPDTPLTPHCPKSTPKKTTILKEFQCHCPGDLVWGSIADGDEYFSKGGGVSC